MKKNKFDVVGAIISYEQGELSEGKALELFAELIKTGLVWNLQGCYGRMAQRLIEAGYITKEGKIA